MDKETLPNLVSRGLLERDRRGLYRVSTVPRAPDHLPVEAVLLTGGVLSHRSAAHRHGLTRQAGVVEVTVESSKRPRQTALWAVHRARSLSSDEIQVVGGLPVTCPNRTLLDLSRPNYDMESRALLSMVAGALQRRLVRPRSLEAYLAAQPRTPGVARLQRLVQELTGVKLDSVAEHLLFDLLATGGVPLPEPGCIIRDQHGDFVAKTDFGWRRERLALEMDGYQFHSDPVTFEADRARGNLIVAAGWTLLRTTPRQVAERGNDVVASVKAGLVRDRH